MEYRRKCTVCGKIYCYSDQDVSNNVANSLATGLSALGAVSSLFGGTRLDTYALNSQTDRYADKVVDFTQCPNCHSRNTVPLTEEELVELQKPLELSAGEQSRQTVILNFNK